MPKTCQKTCPKPKCPPVCRPIRFCPPAPDVCCPRAPPAPRSTFKCYSPCSSPRCPCPPSWPTLCPQTDCCVKKPRIEDPFPLPVLPRCCPPRWAPEQCRPRIIPELKCKEYPPLLPCCSPCRPLPPPPGSWRRIRCLDPVIPRCPRPCIPKPRLPLIPEPPYPPFCPVLPPCNCPAVPLIVHNSVRYYQPTTSCDKAKDINNPAVCYVPVDRKDIAQISCDMDCCVC